MTNGSRIVDLTAVLEEGTPVNHPHHPRGPVVLPNQKYDFVRWFYADTWRRGGGPPVYDGMPEDWAQPDTARGWRNEEVLIHTHLGTHVDAAQHFNPDSTQDAATIPLETCFGRAVMLDVRHLGEDGEAFPITVEDLDAAVARAGAIVGEGDIVILHTGWLARWGRGRTPTASAMAASPTRACTARRRPGFWTEA